MDPKRNKVILDCTRLYWVDLDLIWCELNWTEVICISREELIGKKKENSFAFEMVTIRKRVTHPSKAPLKAKWDSFVKGSRGGFRGYEGERLTLWFNLQNQGTHFANSTNYRTNMRDLSKICPGCSFERVHSLELATWRAKSKRLSRMFLYFYLGWMHTRGWRVRLEVLAFWYLRF